MTTDKSFTCGWNILLKRGKLGTVILINKLPKLIRWIPYFCLILPTPTAGVWRVPSLLMPTNNQNPWILETLFTTAYFKRSNTKCNLICSINHFDTTTEASSHGLPYLSFYGFAQSVWRKMNGALGLAALEMPGNCVPSCIVPWYKSISSSTFLNIFWIYSVQIKGIHKCSQIIELRIGGTLLLCDSCSISFSWPYTSVLLNTHTKEKR